MYTAPTDDMLKDILQNSETIAVVRASDKPDRASYRVMNFLIAKGYDIYPVNPHLAGQSIQGRKVYASLKDIPQSIDIVDIFRRPEETPTIVDEALSISAKTIWMQLGVTNEAAAQTALKEGLNVVMDRCPAIEMPRLGL